MKAVAVNTLFTIIATVIFLFFAIIIIYGFIATSTHEASQTECNIKFINYCLSWLPKGFVEGQEPYKWNEKGPTGCNKFLKDIDDTKGPTKEQCKPVAKI